MLPLGTPAPPFSLNDPSGRTYSFDDLSRDHTATVVMFICNHCPYVQHIATTLGTSAHQWAAIGVAIAAVNPNDFSRYEDDSPAAMAAYAKSVGWEFPYLIDENQSTAIAYKAACTPDFYLFDGDHRLVYRGQFDGSRPSNDIPPSGTDLDRAIRSVIEGSPVDKNQIPSLGCSIKWKPGNEPKWAP